MLNLIYWFVLGIDSLTVFCYRYLSKNETTKFVAFRYFSILVVHNNKKRQI